jgi:hypothetical protein
MYRLRSVFHCKVLGLKAKSRSDSTHESELSFTVKVKAPKN